MTLHSGYAPATRPHHDLFDEKIDVNALVDIQHHTFSDRQTVKTASFSRVADFSTLEVSDKVLFFMPYDEYKAFIEKYPKSTLGASALGMVDANSYLPVLVTIKSMHLDSHDARDMQLKFEEGLGLRGVYRKQVWRFIG